MKNMVMGFGFFMMMLLSSMIIVSASKKQIIKEELNEAISISIRNSMELWADNQNITKEQIIDNFMVVFNSNYIWYIFFMVTYKNLEMDISRYDKLKDTYL